MSADLSGWGLFGPLGAAISGAFSQALVSWLRDAGIPLRIGRFNLEALLGASETSVDERLQKIDQARQNLTDALSALEELGRQGQQQKVELEELTAAIAHAANEKSAVTNELQTVRSLANLDTQTVRVALGMPTRGQRWFERGLSFFLGVIASLIASLIFDWWRT